MPPMSSVASLAKEKTFRRLLTSTENCFEKQSIEEWKLHQFVNSLTEMLNDMHKSVNRPSLKQLDEYKRRVDVLRENINLTRLEDQIFPREIHSKTQNETPVKEQESQTSTSATVINETENASKTSTKSDHPILNRQQQYIHSEEEKQDDIALSMSRTTRNLYNNAKRINDIMNDDKKKIAEAQNLIDNNTVRLNVQSRRLKHNAYNGSNCWIYLMLIIVIVTFIYLTLFMRMFRKRITPATNSYTASKMNLLNNSMNQTAINGTNITTTKSTDYISLLLNYANENHTDL